jgi:hypothetical protein
MKLICALSIVFALGATPAFADEPTYEPVHLPKCTLYKTADGQEVCGYTLEQWKGALRVDAELVHCKAELKKEKERSAYLAQQKTALQGQVSVYADSQKTLVDRNNQLTKDLIDLDKKYQYERVKPRWGSPVAWTVAAVATSVLAGFVVHDLID